MATRLVFTALAAVLVVACASTREPEAVVREDGGPPVVVVRLERPEPLHFPGTVVPRDETAPERYCELGEKRACGMQLPTRDGIPRGPFEHCMQYADGSFRFDHSTCNTPLVVSFDERPVVFTAAPAVFQVGVSERTEWVSPVTPWLALDRDGSGCIEDERELFAGFAPLAELDDNHDGVIDDADGAFGALVLWADRDQDKRCEPGELTTLATAGITALELAHRTPEVTAPGSHEGETALVHGRYGAKARLIDVYLAPAAGVH